MNFSKTYQYLPYEELEILWNTDLSGFELCTPWVSINVDVEPDQKEKLLQITDSIYSSLSTNNLQLQISDFLGFFHDYPVAYIKPRDYLKKSETNIKNVEAELLTKSPRELAISFMPENLTLKKEQLEQLPLEWTWNSNEVLRLSEICYNSTEPLYDPLSVYRVLQRLRLITEHNFDNTGEILDILNTLKSTNEEKFFASVILVISQSYYVTHRCRECLTPALYNYLPATTAVQNFIKQEEGHDLLIWQSLKALGVDNTNYLQILPDTKLNMEILKQAAQHYFLAFCCIVGAFEGSVYREEDPIGYLLKSSSIPEAAFGLERHFLINKEGNHAAIGEEFVTTMESVSKQEVIIASRFTEFLTHAGNLMTSSLLKKIQENV